MEKENDNWHLAFASTSLSDESMLITGVSGECVREPEARFLAGGAHSLRVIGQACSA